jgi:hypothetical protein
LSLSSRKVSVRLEMSVEFLERDIQARSKLVPKNVRSETLGLGFVLE